MSLSFDKLYVTQRDLGHQEDCKAHFKPITVLLDNNLQSIGLAYVSPSIHSAPDVIVELYSLTDKVFVPIFRFNISNTIKRDCIFRCFCISDTIKLNRNPWFDDAGTALNQSHKLKRQADSLNGQNELLTVLTDKELCGVNFIDRKVIFLIGLENDVEDPVVRCQYEYSNNEAQSSEGCHKVKNLYILTRQTCRIFALNNLGLRPYSNKHQYDSYKESVIHEAKGYSLLDMHLTYYQRAEPTIDTELLVIISCSDSTLRFLSCGELLLSYKLEYNCDSLVEKSHQVDEASGSLKTVFICRTSSSLEAIGLIQDSGGPGLRIQKYWSIKQKEMPISPCLLSSITTLDSVCCVEKDSMLLVSRHRRFLDLYSFVNKGQTQDDIEWLGLSESRKHDHDHDQEINWTIEPSLMSTLDLGHGIIPLEMEHMYHLYQSDIVVLVKKTGQIFILNRSGQSSSSMIIEAIASDQHVEHQLQKLDKICDSAQRVIHNHHGPKQLEDLDLCNISIPPKSLSLSINFVVLENNVTFLSIECNIPMEQMIISSTAMIHFYDCDLPNIVTSHIVNDQIPYQNHAFMASARQSIDYQSSNSSSLSSIGNVTSWVYLKMQPTSKLALPIKCIEGHPGKVVVYVINGGNEPRFMHNGTSVAYTEYIYIQPLCLHKKVSCDVSDTTMSASDLLDISQKSDDSCSNSVEVKGNLDILVGLDWLSKCLPDIVPMRLEQELRSNSKSHLTAKNDTGIDSSHDGHSNVVRLEYRSVVLDTKLCIKLGAHHIKITSDNVVAINTIKEFLMAEATKQSVTIDVVSKIQEKNLRYLLFKIHRKLVEFEQQECTAYTEALNRMAYMNSILFGGDRNDDEMKEAYEELIEDLKSSGQKGLTKRNRELDTMMTKPSEMKRLIKETYYSIVVQLFLNQHKSSSSVCDRKLMQRKFEELDNVLISGISDGEKFVEAVMNFWSSENSSQ